MFFSEKREQITAITDHEIVRGSPLGHDQNASNSWKETTSLLLYKVASVAAASPDSLSSAALSAAWAAAKRATGRRKGEQLT